MILYISIVGDDSVNISVDELKKRRAQLEDKYDALEKDIYKLYSLNKLEEAALQEKKQNLLDMQISYIDQIIANLLETPKIYDKLNRLKQEYEELVGE